MTLKDVWLKIMNRLQSYKLFRPVDYQQQPDSMAVTSENARPAQPAEEKQIPENSQVLVRMAQLDDKAQSLEKLQSGFEQLVRQMMDINAHLDFQIIQRESLISQIDKLPKLMENCVSIVENQKQLTEQLLEQLKIMVVKDQQFVDAVGKIPTETARQTDKLDDINHQLSAAAEADVQMAETFGRFNESVGGLDHSVISQTDSIMQMNNTFAASDRELKSMIAVQNKRFMWMVIAAGGVCMLAILILAGIIIYLKW